MLEKHEKKQKVAYQIIKNEIDNNKLSHAYIIESNRCADTNDFIYCMLADILDKPELYEVIKNNNYPDVKFMQTLDLQFKKNEILELQKEFKTKPLYGKYKIYVIKEANKLGENLSNIMLKFIEEPEEGVIAFFVVDNEHQLLDTIVSRCQVIPLNSNNTYEKTFENFYILNCIPYNSIEEIYTQIDTLVKFCICIEKYKHEAIIYENKYFTSLFTNKGEYYRGQTIRKRNLQFDLDHNWIEIY